MNSDKPIIEVRKLGKRYDIAHARGGYVSLRDVVANIIKSPFSYLKRKTKQVVGLEKKEIFWALRDASFTVQKGEIIGVIGSNGAGKSTLLKILTGITPPTEGEAIIRGRVGSLLEVGTGFHPELSGRDNVFLNGAILGMKRKEIAKKFDEIVKFAGIEKFIDTPVKFYSSGMYVRLAFSVAAHMDPEILLVDEVLAVGDAEFQKKCLGKMNEITKEEGRTILFVSHNMGAIQTLCSQCILLEHGEIVKIGKTSEVIAAYTAPKEKGTMVTLADPGKDIYARKIWIENEAGTTISSMEMGNDVFLNLEYVVKKEIPISDIDVLVSKDGIPVLQSFDIDLHEEYRSNRQPGVYTGRVKLPTALFKEGLYGVQITIGTFKNISDPNAAIKLEIMNTKIDVQNKSYHPERGGFLYTNLDWKEEKMADFTETNI